jgi:hypothetical protein
LLFQGLLKRRPFLKVSRSGVRGLPNPFEREIEVPVQSGLVHYRACQSPGCIKGRCYPVKRFQANVATLPIDASSIFIRWAMRTPYARWNTDPNRLVMTLSPISELVDLFKADRAPASFPEIIGATKEPQTVVDSMCRTVRCLDSSAASPK